MEVWDSFLVKHIEHLESVQSKTVHFIGNLKGRGGESKKKGLDMLADRRKNKRLNILY